MNLSGKFQTLLIIFVVVVWMLVVCGCSTLSRQPAKQQKHNTSSAITVESVDLNGDGLIDTQEKHQITSDQPGVLLTFVCISTCVILICAICAWMSRNRTSDTPHTSHDTHTSDGGQLLSEMDLGDGVVYSQPPTRGSDDWLDSEQDFEGVMVRGPGKRG